MPESIVRGYLQWVIVFPGAFRYRSLTRERGIVLGGSGNGEAIAANRVHGIRCALCWSVETARLARQHNNANMISIGARLTSWSTVEQILDTWLTTDFEGGRHVRRIEKIDS